MKVPGLMSYEELQRRLETDPEARALLEFTRRLVAGFFPPTPRERQEGLGFRVVMKKGGDDGDDSVRSICRAEGARGCGSTEPPPILEES